MNKTVCEGFRECTNPQLANRSSCLQDRELKNKTATTDFLALKHRCSRYLCLKGTCKQLSNAPACATRSFSIGLIRTQAGRENRSNNHLLYAISVAAHTPTAVGTFCDVKRKRTKTTSTHQSTQLPNYDPPSKYSDKQGTSQRDFPEKLKNLSNRTQARLGLTGTSSRRSSS